MANYIILAGLRMQLSGEGRLSVNQQRLRFEQGAFRVSPQFVGVLILFRVYTSCWPLLFSEQTPES